MTNPTYATVFGTTLKGPALITFAYSLGGTEGRYVHGNVDEAVGVKKGLFVADGATLTFKTKTLFSYTTTVIDGTP